MSVRTPLHVRRIVEKADAERTIRQRRRAPPPQHAASREPGQDDPDRFSDVSPSEKWGYVVWAAMGVVIAVPEIWAAVAGSDFIWPTISTTVGTTR